ncbi:uncharacterized protein LOC123719053 [Pieris brassicae]|uniref:uncharacterized protein LOC123719053 n=1 Tax=Pieris brassicae TaxID=7116 RepID=UPI001E661076|nr:uncharacterized protein LOC123719053 [Pieris brassicae]
MTEAEKVDEIELSDDSSEIHPNIDEKSYKKWRRQIREEEKSRNRARLKELKEKTDISQEESDEIQKLEKALKPHFISKSDGGFRISSGCENESEDIDYSEELLSLVKDSSLTNFIDIISYSRLDLDKFEDFVLFNLSENIKEGNDDVGLILSKVSLYLGYVKNSGRLFVNRLCDELQIPDKKVLFEEDVKKYYCESKDAILALQKN